MGGIAGKHNDEAGRETKSCFEPLCVAPFHLVANPSVGKDADYSAPQEEWLSGVPAISEQTRVSSQAPGHATCSISPTHMQHAADFAWTLACPFEKPQDSILHLRNPYAPATVRKRAWIDGRNAAAPLPKDRKQTEPVLQHLADS